MKVSLNTVKRYTSLDLSVEDLVAKINAQLGGVESVTDLGARYKDALVVKVVSCEDHPDADRLHVCRIDDGGVMEDIERDADRLIQVVCGAPNVHAGMMAVWLPPGSTVPASFSEKEPFVLGARELRGVMSYGMLASPQELGLGDSHDGLLELDPDEPRPDDAELKPGTRFAPAFGLDDTIIDIENKMFTHRPDCFGQIGVAREIAGIRQQAFVSPDWYLSAPTFDGGQGLELTVTNGAPEQVPRFMAVAIKGVKVGPSPVWLQSELVRLGSKPINNVVDVTNYLMLLTGQPLHAYDYNKLSGATLGARLAKDGEAVTLLNGKRYELTNEDIVIVDGSGPVGLGGVMGGGESEVSATTQNIVLESATFDMYTIRKTSMRHGLFTDAVTRFNKGQSPLQNDRVLALALRTIFDAAGGSVASPVYDEKATELTVDSVSVTAPFINERLGLNLTADEIQLLLENVECGVRQDGERLTVTPPFWRTDLEIAEDVVEEVGRLYGFDRLPRVLPRRSIKPAALNEKRQLKQAIREGLCRAGANEVLTYSFVHENVLKRAGQDSEDAFRLGNALSPDLQYYRLSVLPSLLDKVHPNVKAGYDEFVLFELGKGHHKQNISGDGLPAETELLELVYTSRKPREGAAYYQARHIVEALLDTLGITVIFEVVEDMPYAGMAPYDYMRSASIKTLDGDTLGVVGEVKAEVRRGFKLPDYTAAATINVASLLGVRRGITYRPLPRFPKVSQDISLKVPVSTKFSEVFKLTDDTVRAAEVSSGYALVEPRTIYQPKDSDTKTITLHVEVASEAGTLTDKQVGEVLAAVAERAAQELQAERV